MFNRKIANRQNSTSTQTFVTATNRGRFYVDKQINV